jgi:hypothetical protein
MLSLLPTKALNKLKIGYVQEKRILTIWKTFNFSASKHWFGWTSTSYQVSFKCLIFIHASKVGTMRYLNYIQSISLHNDTHFNNCESNIDCNN